MSHAIEIQIRQTSASASEAAIRGHRVEIDRPGDKGGGDRGPMGGELFLAAVGGCFMSNLLAASRARDAGISDFQVTVKGMVVDSPARFDAIELRIWAEDAEPELIEHLVEIADHGCIMMNTLRGKLPVRLRVIPIQSETTAND